MQLEVRDTIITFKNLNGLTLGHFFTTRSEIYEGNTRNKDKLHVPLYRTTTAQRSFKYRGTSLWNNLPKEIRDISSLDSFKKQIMNRAFYKFLENDCNANLMMLYFNSLVVLRMCNIRIILIVLNILYCIV